MAEDKRGQVSEPQIEDDFDELPDLGRGEDFIAGPTSRNSIGDAKRAAAKATGLMGASRKLDPDLDIRHANNGRVKSGSSAGVHGFTELSPNKEGEASLILSNEEVAGILPTTVLKSPAIRPEYRERDPKPLAMKGGAESRRRVPAPGTMVDVAKGKLVRKA